MTLNTVIPALLFLAGSLGLPAAHAQAPDYKEVTRLQTELQKAQAKNDWFGAAIDLKLLAKQYKNDPSMLSITYTQLANTYAPHDQKKAAEYRALAQGATAQPAAAPAPLPVYPAQSVYSAQPVAAPQASVSPQPTSEIPAPIALPAGGAPKVSNTDKMKNIFAEAQQIMRQAKQVQAAMKKKSADTPQPGQAPPPPGGLPAGPDGAAAPQPAAVAAGVVVGYDGNNQPIFATPATVPAADAPVAAGVVVGYDANNQPIFATAPATQTPPPTAYPTPHR